MEKPGSSHAILQGTEWKWSMDPPDQNLARSQSYGFHSSPGQLSEFGGTRLCLQAGVALSFERQLGLGLQSLEPCPPYQRPDRPGLVEREPVTGIHAADTES